MDVGSVLREAWELYRRHVVGFVLTAAVVFVAVDLVAALAEAGADEGFFAGLVWGAIGTAVTLVGFFWLQGALIETSRDVRERGGAASVTAAYAATRSHLSALIVGGVLLVVGVAVGLLLLIVPGLYLLTRWALVVPVIVLEDRRAGESFSRSSELVKGHGWDVFGVVIVTLVGLIVGRRLIQALFAPLPDFIDGWLGGLVASSVLAPFVALAWTTMYYRLREVEA
jgi:hypothetical protein